eukprot:2449644-Amphidinium_carterae.1
MCAAKENCKKQYLQAGSWEYWVRGVKDKNPVVRVDGFPQFEYALSGNLWTVRDEQIGIISWRCLTLPRFCKSLSV